MRYDYKCANCEHVLNDVVQSIHDKPLKKCPNCKKHKLERVIFSNHVYCKGEATTVGQWAEKNSKKMGKYGVQDREHADNKDKIDAKKAMRQEVSRLGKMTKEQQERYIHEG